MTGPALRLASYLDALEATWPAALREATQDGLVLRDDAQEAGSRVRSARQTQEPEDAESTAQRIETFYSSREGGALFQAARNDLAVAEAPLSPLEKALAARGFKPFDPCVLAAADCGSAAETALERADARGAHAVDILTPLAILDRFWAEVGVGPARQAIMSRALANGLPGGVLAARIDSRIQGVAFWAAAPDGLAFVHALHVASQARGQGGAPALIGLAAQKAHEAGARQICASIRLGDERARAVFARCGFEEVGGYLYWRKAAPS